MLKTILIKKFQTMIPGEFDEFKSGKIVMIYKDRQVLGMADVIHEGKPKTHNTTLEMDDTTKTYLEGLAGNVSEFSELEILEFRLHPDSIEVWAYGIYEGRKCGKLMIKI